MYSQFLFILDQLEPNIYHKLFYDNLFISVKLCRGAVNAKAKVLSLSVARYSGRRVPPAVFQLEESNEKRKEEVVGTLKSVVLIHDKKVLIY